MKEINLSAINADLAYNPLGETRIVPHVVKNPLPPEAPQPHQLEVDRENPLEDRGIIFNIDESEGVRE